MITMRPWTIEDAWFVVKLRNNPELKQWFRQERDITLDEQILFMTHSPNYRGYMLIEDNKAVGVFALNGGRAHPFPVYILTVVANIVYCIPDIATLTYRSVKSSAAMNVEESVIFSRFA